MKLAGGKLTTGRSGNIDYSDFAGSNQKDLQGYFDRVGDRLTSKQNVGGSVGASVGVFFTDLIFTKR